MIDFDSVSFVKLRNVPLDEVPGDVSVLLLDGESVEIAAKGLHDYVVFTDRRLITVSAHGASDEVHDYTTLPYGRAYAFSVTAHENFDRDSQLEIWSSVIGKIRLEFDPSVDAARIGRLIATGVL